MKFFVTVIVLLTRWPSSTGTKVCGQEEFWDTIQERCTPCTEGVCQTYTTNPPKQCHCVCFPDHRDCAPTDEGWDPTPLIQKVDALKIGLIVISVLVVLFILVDLIVRRTFRKAKSHNNKQYSKNLRDFPDRNELTSVNHDGKYSTRMSPLDKAAPPIFKGNHNRSQKKTVLGNSIGQITQPVESVVPFIPSPKVIRGVQEEGIADG